MYHTVDYLSICQSINQSTSVYLSTVFKYLSSPFLNSPTTQHRRTSYFEYVSEMPFSTRQPNPNPVTLTSYPVSPVPPAKERSKGPRHDTQLVHRNWKDMETPMAMGAQSQSQRSDRSVIWHHPGQGDWTVRTLHHLLLLQIDGWWHSDVSQRRWLRGAARMEGPATIAGCYNDLTIDDLRVAAVEHRIEKTNIFKVKKANPHHGSLQSGREEGQTLFISRIRENERYDVCMGEQ